MELQRYWAAQGCVILQPLDLEVGAGTFHPATALRALGPAPWKAAYVQPSRRPTDGRYGENPNRLQHYYQLQVILKPAPADSQDLYLNSLAAIGIDASRHDIRFVEDDWESPTLGAWGLGWEVWLDGMEVSQFTYFQQVGGIECDPVSTELTYGLERLAMYVQGVESVYDLDFNGVEGAGRISYGDVFQRAEREFSAYNFEFADTGKLFAPFRRRRGRMQCADRAQPAAAGLRPVPQGEPSVQPARRARGDQRHRARRLYRPGARAGAGLLRGVAGGEAAEMGELLLELLSEEIPARMQRRAIDDLTGLIRDKLAGADIPAASLTGYVTPRRLTVIADGIPARQPDREEERRGPRVGAPEQALDGFLRRPVSTSHADRNASTVRGEFYFAVITAAGPRHGRGVARIDPRRDDRAALAQIDALSGFGAALGAAAQFGDLPVRRRGAEAAARRGSGRADDTRPPLLVRRARFRSPTPRITGRSSPAAHVVLDWSERRALIATDLDRAREGHGLTVKPDPGLLDEVAGPGRMPGRADGLDRRRFRSPAARRPAARGAGDGDAHAPEVLLLPQSRRHPGAAFPLRRQ